MFRERHLGALKSNDRAAERPRDFIAFGQDGPGGFPDRSGKFPGADSMQSREMPQIRGGTPDADGLPG
jgi:hypothetical protein